MYCQLWLSPRNTVAFRTWTLSPAPMSVPMKVTVTSMMADSPSARSVKPTSTCPAWNQV